jgi:hypothetical protein
LFTASALAVNKMPVQRIPAHSSRVAVVERSLN